MSTGRRVTLRDIAAVAGVSAPTVSVVLSGKDQRGKVRVSEATRTRILRAADELGYSPSLLGRSIRLGRTNQVCIVGHYLYSPWTQALVDAVSAACRAEGKRPLILADGDWQGFLAGQGADGAVIDAERLTSDDLRRLSKLAAMGIAIVVLDDDAAPDGFDVISKPVQPALGQAVSELAARHRRIAILPADRDNAEDQRLAACRAAIEAAGGQVDPALIRSTRADRYVAFHQSMELLQAADPPTAIVSTQDLGAIGALWAAQRLGVAVPDQLEIIGVGNTPETRAADPQVSSIGADLVFADVAELLMQRLRGEGPEQRRHVYPGQIWHRGTTRA